MRCDNFRVVVGGGVRSGKTVAQQLAQFFGQFEPAYAGFRPVLSLADHAAIARDLADRPAGHGTSYVSSPTDPWGASPLAGTRDPHDARAHAREFRERMAAERARLGVKPRSGDPSRFGNRVLDRIWPLDGPVEGDGES